MAWREGRAPCHLLCGPQASLLRAPLSFQNPGYAAYACIISILGRIVIDRGKKNRILVRRPKTVPLLCYTPAARQSLFFEMDRDGWVSISMLLSCLFFFGYKVEVNVMARHMQLHASIGTGFREQSEWGQSFTMVLGRRWE